MGSFIVLCCSIIATGYLGMMYENAELMLLVYLQVALFVLSFFIILYRKFTVKARLEVPVGIAEPGKESLVKLVVTNNGLFSMARMAVLVLVEDVCTGTKKKQWMKLANIPKGEGSFQRMISLSGMGTYRLRLKKLRVYDITGLFSGKVRCKSETQIQVLPNLYEVSVKLSHSVRNFYGEADVYDEQMPGHDNSEMFQVREYRMGDRLQNIHWKLTAKQDDLMVKEHSLPKACPVVLFLDYHPKRHVKHPEKIIPYLEAAASLSFSFADAGCPHYVVWYDEEVQDIKRLRVENEESLFYFLGMLLQIRWKQPKEDMRQRYKEKYRMEPFVRMLSFNEKLVLENEEGVLASFSEKDLERSLSLVDLTL